MCQENVRICDQIEWPGCLLMGLFERFWVFDVLWNTRKGKSIKIFKSIEGSEWLTPAPKVATWLGNWSSWTRRTAPSALSMRNESNSTYFDMRCEILQSHGVIHSLAINWILISSPCSRKLKVRNSSPMSSQAPSSNQNELALRQFWRHVNTFYFKKTETTDVERLEYLSGVLNTPIKGINPFIFLCMFW